MARPHNPLNFLHKHHPATHIVHHVHDMSRNQRERQKSSRMDTLYTTFQR